MYAALRANGYMQGSPRSDGQNWHEWMEIYYGQPGCQLLHIDLSQAQVSGYVEVHSILPFIQIILESADLRFVICCSDTGLIQIQSLSVKYSVYSRASSVPGSGCQSYSQRTCGGRDISIDSMRPTPDCKPNIVPRSITRLNST